MRKGRERKQAHQKPAPAATLGIVSSALDDLSVDEMANQKMEQEQIEIRPRNGAELKQASKDKIEELKALFAHNDKAYEVLLEIDRRLDRYFGEGEQISPYAEAAIAEEPSPTTIEIHKMLAAEINPLLYEFRLAILEGSISTQAEDDIVSGDSMIKGAWGQPEILMHVLSSGHCDAQAMTTIFGLVEDLNPVKPDIDTQIIVTNPLSDEGGYWTERLKHGQREYGTTQEEMIASRSFVAVYALQRERARAEKAGNIEAVAAYRILERFIDKNGDAMRANFAHAVGKLDFVHGRADDLFALFNAAEVVKQHNPDLYARLLGVAPSYKPTPEAQRSDLFGNAFHIAVYRSQSLELGANLGTRAEPGKQLLRQRVALMTHMKTSQLALQRINTEQMRMIFERLQEETAKPSEDDLEGETGEDPEQKKQRTRNPVMQMALLGILLKGGVEYQLHELLDTVAMAEREERLRELKCGTPEQVIEIIKTSPPEIIYSPEFDTVLADRLDEILDEKGEVSGRLLVSVDEGARASLGSSFEEDELECADIIDGIRALNDRWDFIEGRRSENKMPNARIHRCQAEINLRLALWETAPKEAILSMNFFRGLEDILKRLNTLERAAVDIKGAQGDIVARAKKEVGRRILKALSAHDDISQLDWFEWHYDVVNQYKVGLMTRDHGENRFKAVSEVIQQIFSLFDIKDVLLSPTSFLFLHHRTSSEWICDKAREEGYDRAEIAICAFRENEPEIGAIKTMLALARMTRAEQTKFFGYLSDNEKIDFLKKLFDSGFTENRVRVNHEIMIPNNPIQIELLRMADAMIPDFEPYRMYKQTMIEKGSPKEFIPAPSTEIAICESMELAEQRARENSSDSRIYRDQNDLLMIAVFIPDIGDVQHQNYYPSEPYVEVRSTKEIAEEKARSHPSVSSNYRDGDNNLMTAVFNPNTGEVEHYDYHCVKPILYVDEQGVWQGDRAVKVPGENRYYTQRVTNWRTMEMKQREVIGGTITQKTVIIDGRTCASIEIFSEGSVIIWDAHTMKEIRKLEPPRPREDFSIPDDERPDIEYAGQLETVAVCDGKVITGTHNGYIDVYNPSTGECEKTIKVDTWIEKLITLNEREVVVIRKKYTENEHGEQITKRTLEIVDIETGEIRSMPLEYTASDYAVLPDDKLVALDYHPEIIDARTGETIAKLQTGEMDPVEMGRPVYAETIAANSKYIAYAARNSDTVVVWDAQTHERLHVLKFGMDNNSIVITDDDKIIIGNCPPMWGGNIGVFDLKSGEMLFSCTTKHGARDVGLTDQGEIIVAGYTMDSRAPHMKFGESEEPMKVRDMMDWERASCSGGRTEERGISKYLEDSLAMSERNPDTERLQLKTTDHKIIEISENNEELIVRSIFEPDQEITRIPLDLRASGKGLKITHLIQVSDRHIIVINEHEQVYWIQSWPE